MFDRAFLIWLHERLEHMHGEEPRVEHMRKLRAIIGATPPDQFTANMTISNSLEALLESLDDA